MDNQGGSGVNLVASIFQGCGCIAIVAFIIFLFILI